MEDQWGEVGSREDIEPPDPLLAGVPSKADIFLPFFPFFLFFLFCPTLGNPRGLLLSKPGSLLAVFRGSSEVPRIEPRSVHETIILWPQIELFPGAPILPRGSPSPDPGFSQDFRLT